MKSHNNNQATPFHAIEIEEAFRLLASGGKVSP